VDHDQAVFFGQVRHGPLGGSVCAQGAVHAQEVFRSWVLFVQLYDHHFRPRSPVVVFAIQPGRVHSSVFFGCAQCRVMLNKSTCARGTLRHLASNEDSTVKEHPITDISLRPISEQSSNPILQILFLQLSNPVLAIVQNLLD
jgi:hypothetical protein